MSVLGPVSFIFSTRLSHFGGLGYREGIGGFFVLSVEKSLMETITEFLIHTVKGKGFKYLVKEVTVSLKGDTFKRGGLLYSDQSLNTPIIKLIGKYQLLYQGVNI